MSDYTVVYFNAIKRGFSIPSTLAHFSIGGMEFQIRWYGLLIAIGYALALVAATRLATKKKINVDAFYDAVIFGTLGGIIGARLFYVLFNWDYYSAAPSKIMSISEGGLAIYGGVIGSFLVGLLVCKIRKISVLDVFDLASVGFLLGQGIGRWGNFTNQEAFGTNTTLPWGMTSTKVSEYIINHQDYFASKGITVDPNVGVHPTFLYESIWCIIGFVLLYIMFDKHRKFKGQIILSYGIWYGIIRAIVEGLRTDSLYIGSSNVRISQLISIVLVVVCTGLLIWQLIKHKGEKVEIPLQENEEKENEDVKEESKD